jgi:hypothetical protein
MEFPPTSAAWLSAFSHLCVAIFSLINLFFAFKLFSFQNKSIRLSWFRELVILPHWKDVKKFYDEDAIKICEKLKAANLTPTQKSEILDELKTSAAMVRRNFIDSLLPVNKKIYNGVKGSLDTMVDNITNIAMDDGINLSHPPAFQKHISSKINYAKNNTIGIIYSFKGK